MLLHRLRDGGIPGPEVPISEKSRNVGCSLEDLLPSAPPDTSAAVPRPRRMAPGVLARIFAMIRRLLTEQDRFR